MYIHEELLKLRQREIKITSEILDKVQQMEDCRGYLEMGYSSLFDYLVKALKYSGATVYERQACVRLAREVPEIKQKIDQGSLTISAVTTAYKYIRKKPTSEKRQTLKSIENKSTREVKKIFLQASKPIQIKKTVYQDKVHIRLELSHKLNKKLEKLKALKSHKHDLESLFEELIEKELRHYEKTQFRITKSKNPRQISQSLRNHLFKKSNYQCQYPGCGSKYFLQVDHIVPVRLGGGSAISNLQILCANHNQVKA